MNTNDEDRLNIVVQTAYLRHSVRYEGLRILLQSRGYVAKQCLQLSCDQGYDVNITLVLPDGTLVIADYREDPISRQATEFSNWIIEQYCDREIEIARAIVSESDTSQFDNEVFEYFKNNLANTDGPLPPKTE